MIVLASTSTAPPTLTAPSTSPAAVRCDPCGVDVPSRIFQGHLRSLVHKARACREVESGVETIQSAFNSRIASYRVSSQRHHIVYNDFFEELGDKIKKLLVKEARKFRSIKVNLELFGRFIHPVKELTDIKSFNTRNKIINEASDWNSIYDDFVGEMTAKASEFQERESGKLIIVDKDEMK